MLPVTACISAACMCVPPSCIWQLSIVAGWHCVRLLDVHCAGACMQCGHTEREVCSAVHCCPETLCLQLAAGRVAAVQALQQELEQAAAKVFPEDTKAYR